MTAPSDLTIWAMIFGLAAATYLLRVSFLGLIGGRRLPPAVLRGLSFVPVTVLPALVAPAVFTDQAGAFDLDPAKLVPAAVTVGVGMAGRSLLPALLAGLAAWALMAVAGL